MTEDNYAERLLKATAALVVALGSLIVTAALVVSWWKASNPMWLNSAAVAGATVMGVGYLLHLLRMLLSRTSPQSPNREPR